MKNDNILGIDRNQKMTGKPVIAMALMFVFLVSCQGNKPKVDPLAGGGGLTGKWVSADNVFTAQFANGAFTSTANDTGALLSEGNYVVISANEVHLNWRGRVSQQDNSAKCQRPSIDVLNCSDSAGKPFTLRKSS